MAGAAWDSVMVRDMCSQVNYSDMGAGVKVNRLPGTLAICRKDKLWNNYKLLQTKYGDEVFNFLPQTFNIPEERKELRMAMAGRKEVWIAKPTASSCGDGISLETRFSQIKMGKSVLSVQKYISNPLLINGLKFDLRLYVLMTNIDPLTIYLYEDGIVRFATKQYSINKEDIDDKFIHLTNYSINKRNEDFEFNEAPEELSGHKWSLKMLWRYLEGEKIDYAPIWEEIKDIIVKTILSGYNSMKTMFDEDVSSDYNCYKLFGFDVMLDKSLKPWLLEVNNFPTLNHKSLDRHVNESMITEILNIVGFHITAPINDKKKANIMEKTGLETLIEFDPQMYSRKKDDEQMQKEKDWADNKSGMFAEENLTALDVRVLIRAEEELEQTANFSRLFPAIDSRYAGICEGQSYRDTLLQHWEKRHGSNTNNRRDVLVRLCKKGVHSQDFVSHKIDVEKKIVIKTPKPRRISKREKRIAARKALEEAVTELLNIDMKLMM